MIILTEKAAEEIKRVILDENLFNYVLRVGIKGVDRNGFQYSLGFDTKTSDDDLISEQYGVTVAISKKFDLHLSGTNVDYKNDRLKSGFKFDNPNEKE